MTAGAASGLALAILLLGASGCASSGPYWSPEDQGAAEASELRERVASLEAQLAAADVRSHALQAKADALERDVERLRGLGGAPEAVSLPVPPAAQGLATLPDPATPSAPENPETVPVPPQRSGIEQSDLNELDELDEVREDEPRLLYERSLELLEQGRLPEAEAGLTRFLAANPDSDLADNAQFWLAEGALRRGDVASALAGFRAVVENYPEANKIPDALLKVGSCLSTLGEPESAATVYRELLARFPESAAAETARQRLGAL